MDKDKIIEGIKKKAKENNLELTENLDKIAQAKLWFFGDDWTKCPCDRNSDRACISKHCLEDIKKNGTCHCHLYKVKD